MIFRRRVSGDRPGLRVIFPAGILPDRSMHTPPRTVESRMPYVGRDKNPPDRTDAAIAPATIQAGFAKTDILWLTSGSPKSPISHRWIFADPIYYRGRPYTKALQTERYARSVCEGHSREEGAAWHPGATPGFQLVPSAFPDCEFGCIHSTITRWVAIR